jgi:hypothetical protein
MIKNANSADVRQLTKATAKAQRKRRCLLKSLYIKVPLGQFESPLNLQPMPLVWLVEECPDFKDILKEQSIAVRQDADLIDNIPTSSKSFESCINTAKLKEKLHPLIIMKIIAKIECLQAKSLKKQSKVSKNVPDVIYWYDRLLSLLKGNGNYGMESDWAFLSLKGRLLYYEPSNDDIPNNDLSNVELEEVLDLKKQLVDVQPTDVHYLSIATTFIQLGRY